MTSTPNDERDKVGAKENRLENVQGSSGIVLEVLAELSWILNGDQQMLGSTLMSVLGLF